jgi:hypothetical protein
MIRHGCWNKQLCHWTESGSYAWWFAYERIYVPDWPQTNMEGDAEQWSNTCPWWHARIHRVLYLPPSLSPVSSVLSSSEWQLWQDGWVKNMLCDKTTIIVTALVKNPSNEVPPWCDRLSSLKPWLLISRLQSGHVVVTVSNMWGCAGILRRIRATKSNGRSSNVVLLRFDNAIAYKQMHGYKTEDGVDLVNSQWKCIYQSQCPRWLINHYVGDVPASGGVVVMSETLWKGAARSMAARRRGGCVLVEIGWRGRWWVEGNLRDR